MMMDNLGLGNVNNLGPVIMSVIGVGISAIILLTFAPTIAGDISGIALQGKTEGYCDTSGEALDRVVPKGSHATANAAWQTIKAGFTRVVEESVGDNCRAGDLITKAANAAVPAAITYYTPEGEEVTSTLITRVGIGTTSEGDACAQHATNGSTSCYHDIGAWKAQSDSLGAGGLGTLIQLLFGAMGLMLPAGALGFMGYTGSKLVAERFGGGLLSSALIVVVGVVVVGAILPQIIEPLDTFFLALDGNRFYIFSHGIGKLAGTLGNFMGISLIAGVIALGGLLWKGRGGSSSGSYA